MNIRPLAVPLILALAWTSARAEDARPALGPGGKVVITVALESGDGKEPPLTPEKRREILDRLSPSLVRVEYTLKYDKGEPPGGGRGYSSYSRRFSFPGGGEDHIRDERPLEVAGFLVDARRVVSPDIAIHPRFIRAIRVRYGDTAVGARVDAYGTGQRARLLTLEKDLPGAKPLAFDAAKKPPYLALSHGRENAAWTVHLTALAGGTAVTDDGYRFTKAHPSALVIDREGTPVGLSMNDEQPVDGSWKGSPLRWKNVSATSRAERIGRTRGQADAALLRVKLSFRSPKGTQGSQGGGYSRYRSSDDDADKTERNVSAVLIGPRTLLVLVGLKPGLTARLERIQVHPPGGKPVPAKFKATLADYGAFVAVLDQDLPGAVKLSDKRVFSLRNALFTSVELRLQGEKRVTYYDHRRVSGFGIGWRRQVYPEASGNSARAFLFDAGGTLAALPIARRRKVAVKSRWGGGEEPVLTHASYIGAVLKDLEGNIDKSNVPLVEEDENRIAWVGLILQRLDRELARANDVSELTNDGQIGALVSYVYPDSPEGKAGIKQGSILLRLHVEGQPKPLEITQEGNVGWGIIWSRLSEYRDEQLERMLPWPTARTPLAASLTEIGFGKRYTAEVYQDGRVLRKSFVVTESPPHYDSAPRFKSKTLGMTARNLTYEVRRYFQMDSAKPGVIVSKIKPGEPASVAGIKTYEIITHVNGGPVTDSDAFKRQIAGHKELRFTVKRFIKTRTVKIRLAE